MNMPRLARTFHTLVRISIAMGIGLALLALSVPFAKLLAEWGISAPEVALALTAGGVVLYFAAASHATRVIAFPYADLKVLIVKSMESPIGAAISALGIMMVVSALIMASAVVYADELPPLAKRYAPTLKTEQSATWPNMSMPQALAGQVEQETCISLKHKKCWNPHAELKTSREYGFGLGQLTVTSRFNAFEEVRAMDASLSGWKWEDRYDPARQLRALVLKDKAGYRQFWFATTEQDRLAMMLSGYNGGNGAVLQDRKLCQVSPGCDPGRWFGHVEHHSRKARLAKSGYGKSFYAINREYPRNILFARSGKYVGIMGAAS